MTTSLSNLAAMCMGCGVWKHFKNDPNKFLQTSDLTCDDCGSTNFNPQSLISERTFDQARAAAQTKKYLKSKKR